METSSGTAACSVPWVSFVFHGNGIVGAFWKLCSRESLRLNASIFALRRPWLDLASLRWHLKGCTPSRDLAISACRNPIVTHNCSRFTSTTKIKYAADMRLRSQATKSGSVLACLCSKSSLSANFAVGIGAWEESIRLRSGPFSRSACSQKRPLKQTSPGKPWLSAAAAALICLSRL